MRLLVLVLTAALIAGAGCATIVRGQRQQVMITTQPPGAMVYVDNVPVGPSPVAVIVKHNDHTVTATMAGYQPGHALMTTGFSGWSLVFFPLGTIIDAVTGAITTLDQDAIHIRLFAAPRPGGI